MLADVRMRLLCHGGLGRARTRHLRHVVSKLFMPWLACVMGTKRRCCLNPPT